MNIVQLTGLAAGIITSIAMLPQLVKIIKERDAKDISITMIIVLLIGLGLWVVYGFLKDDLPIIATNIFSFLVNLTLLGFSIRFSSKKRKG